MDFIYLAIGLVAGVIFLAVGLPLIIRMKIPSPEKSEKSFRFLKAEIEKLVAERIITLEQQSTIIARYESFAGQRAALKKNRLVKILATFGAFLIGLGVILFVASNWRGIPGYVLVLLLTSAVLCSYYFGFRLKYQKAAHKNIGQALIILGALLYGATLILTAQIYHIDISFSILMIVWAGGILPVAFLDKSGILIDVAVVLVVIWGFASLEQFGDDDLTWQYYLSLPLLLAFVLPFVYRFKARHCMALALMAGLVWVGPVAVKDWFTGNGGLTVLNLSLLYLFLGLVVATLGEVHRRVEGKQMFYGVYFPLGVAVSMVSTLLLTFPQVYEQEGISFMPIFFNFIFVGEIVGIIYFGLKTEEEKFINAGVAAFGVLLAVRYFSLSWGLGSRSVVFIIGGVVLILVGLFLDRVRKKVIEKMNE